MQKVKRCGHGFTNFEHYACACSSMPAASRWPIRPHPPRIREGAPCSDG